MTPWTVARKAPLFMVFPRQEYQSGLPFPSPGDLPDPGIESASPTMAGGLFTTELPEKPLRQIIWTLWERERVGRFGRMALKHVKYHV